MNQKHLIVFTLFYPYTHLGTSYDENISLQIKKFAETFEKVSILSMSTGHDGSLEVPKNTEVVNIRIEVSKIDLFLLFPLVFRKFFWEELFRIFFVYKLNFSVSVFKSFAVFLVRALKYKKKIGNFLKTCSDNPNTIYSHWTFEYTMAACLLKREYPITLATRYHSLDIYFERYKEKYIPFRSFIFNQCDLNLFISRHGLDYFLKRNKISQASKKKCVISYLGVEEQPEIKQAHDKIILLSNAWIQPLKRLELIIQALNLIVDFSVEWVHVGDDYGTGFFSSISDTAKKQLGTKPNVQYEFAGRKNLAEIKEIFITRKVNLFINTSTTEGVPISMMEALSFGVPLIGTAVGGVPEIIKNEHNGFLLSENPSPEEIAGKIEQYFKLPTEQKAAMMENARNMWDEKFNSSKNSEQVALLLKNL